MILHGALSIPLLKLMSKSYRHRFHKIIDLAFLGSRLSLLEVVFTDFSHPLRLLEVLILML